MLPIFSVLLATRFLVMSDCDHIWDVDKLSTQTMIEWDASQATPPVDFREMHNKKVLLLVHGFNDRAQSALDTYRLICDRIANLGDARSAGFYDCIIGYLWPGYKNPLEYFAAKEHAAELATRMRLHLKLLSTSAAKVDILAHSMGNRLILEALEYLPNHYSKIPVQNFYSLAAAVGEESIENKNKYSFSIKNCQDAYIFHSDRDDVLKFLYTFAEFDEALGFIGVKDLHKLPNNVQLIDCSAIVGGHSGYFNAPSVYGFIQSQQLNKTPSPLTAPSVKLLADGSIVE